MKRRPSDDKVIVATKTKSRKERLVNKHKYIGMDVHKATIVAVVLDDLGNVILESILQTNVSEHPKAATTERLKTGHAK